ncbi:MAG: bile acid:sodium symporter [Pseudomonadota bacterium]
MAGLDQAQLNFNPDALAVLNALLGLIMFGVGLDLRLGDVRTLMSRWPVLLVGLIGQWVLLPLLTVILIVWLKPSPSLALGMIIIAACPGGSVSNYFSHVARGDIALSVSLSALTSAICFITTPLTIALWGGLLPEVSALLATVSIAWHEMLLLVLGVLLLPALAGATLAALRPQRADQLRKPLQRFSMVAFAGFVIAAFAANGRLFFEAAEQIVGLVAVHNAAALLAGYLLARVFRLRSPECRSICIEVGIQNTALGLSVIFTFFDALGGTALITAWWGVWHLITGALVAVGFKRSDLARAPTTMTNV